MRVAVSFFVWWLRALAFRVQAACLKNNKLGPAFLPTWRTKEELATTTSLRLPLPEPPDARAGEKLEPTWGGRNQRC